MSIFQVLDNLPGDHVGGIEFLRRALDVLEWGLRKWKHIPRSGDHIRSQFHSGRSEAFLR